MLAQFAKVQPMKRSFALVAVALIAHNPTPGPTPATNLVSLSPQPKSTPYQTSKRDVRKWPFASTSIWNTPIGSKARYVPAGIKAPPYWGAVTSEDIIVLTPTAPLTDVYENFKDWNDPTPGARCSKDGKRLKRVPIPTNWTYPHEGAVPDSAAAIMLPDGRSLYQTQPFHRCTAGGYATSHYDYPTVDIYGPGIRGAHGGSGLSSIGGTIRVGELKPGGAIRHALKIYIWANAYLAYKRDSTPGYRWPAVKADGAAARVYGGKNPALELGALLALRPSFKVSKLKTEPARMIGRALQDYGAYAIDNAGSENIGLTLERGPDGRAITQFKRTWGYEFQSPRANTPFAADLARLWPALQVVDNNSPSSIGGGGRPRRPRAPPVAP